MSADSRDRLIRQLQGAYSGELAAAYAYRGHWKSLPEGTARERIRVIEGEEWHHRELVAGLLRQLNASPRTWREVIFWTIGRVLGTACHLSGWFLPMYGAGKLERKNIVEYEDAAVYASESGHKTMIDCLLSMAEVEWEHERYFRSEVEGHWMLRMFPVWTPAPPKESIRENFAKNAA